MSILARVQQKSSLAGSEGRSRKADLPRLGRGRRRDVDVCVRLGFGLSSSGRRGINNRGVGFLFLRLFSSTSWRGDSRFFLFARCEQRSASQNADVLFHIRKRKVDAVMEWV